jgi:hypothetical protein
MTYKDINKLPNGTKVRCKNWIYDSCAIMYEGDPHDYDNKTNKSGVKLRGYDFDGYDHNKWELYTGSPFTTSWESKARNHMKQPFMAVKAWKNRYFFSERAGKDSIAFILYDHRTNEYCVINEFKPPIDAYFVTAFGGSFDRPEPFEPIDIVIDEVREEAGFIVTREDIKECGSVMVSTQSNQMCHLFLVNVDKRKQVEPQPENDLEALATTVWMTQDEVFLLQDWKAITIITKSYL